MRLAKLNKRIKIQDFNESADDLGNLFRYWHDVHEVWAAIELYKATKKSDKNNNQRIYKFTIRDTIEIKACMRIKYIMNIFEIIEINKNRERFLTILTNMAK